MNATREPSGENDGVEQNPTPARRSTRRVSSSSSSLIATKNLASRHQPGDLGSTYEPERANDERDGEPDQKRGQGGKRRVLILLEVEEHLDGQRQVRRPHE